MFIYITGSRGGNGDSSTFDFEECVKGFMNPTGIRISSVPPKAKGTTVRKEKEQCKSLLTLS